MLIFARFLFDFTMLGLFFLGNDMKRSKRQHGFQHLSIRGCAIAYLCQGTSLMCHRR